ncbi:MAG: AAA family ATPase, partial [Treponema sp.]|nr:AAA family ATPase [Treponema sp.]
GRLTDGQGRVVDFKNVIIIMTSNLGSELILQAKKLETIREPLMELLKQSFRPEFLNRIDETVIFNRLGKDEIGKIVDIQLARLCARLAERKIELKLTKAAKELLAERGYDPLFGARPLKRAIQADLENPLAKSIIAGTVKEGDMVTADKSNKDGEVLSFKKSTSKAAQ